eukprot:g8845.t1
MADDEVVLLEEARRRPLSERTTHKLWKARVEAYEDMRSKCEKVFSDEDPLLNDYGSYLPKAVIDTNAAALDKALDLTIEYLKKCSASHAAKICDKVCTGIISKALSGRPSTVMKSIEVSLLFVENEQGDKLTEAFISKGFVHKVPKVLLACVDIVYQSVNLFGTKVMTPQPILKSLPALFDSKDAKIRAKVKELVAELAKWCGANAVKTILFEKMRDAMKEDVEKLIAQIPEGRPVAQRLTKSQQQRAVIEDTSGEAGGTSGPTTNQTEEPEEVEIDEYDLAEPSEVVGSLDRDWWANLQEKKWAIRKGALSSLKTLASKPKLANGDYSEINRELKKIILKDSNVQCVAEAIVCVGALGKGLRSHFSSVSKSYCGMLLEKFKEKNMSVCRACMESLTVLQKHCFSLLDVQEDVLEALKHQNPKVKQCTLEWLKICIDGVNKQTSAKLVPVFVSAIASCSDDATPLTRERALAVMVSFCMKATSAAAIDKITAKLDDTRKKKLDELLKEARNASSGGGKTKTTNQTSTQNSKPPGLSAAATRPQPDAVVKMDIDEGPSAPSTSSAPSRPKKSSKGVSKGVPKGGGGLKASTKSSSQSNSTNFISDVNEESLRNGGLTKEDVETRLTELFNEEIIKALVSSVWKERLASLESMIEKLPELEIDAYSTLLIQGVSLVPGWSEKIFQVMGKQFEVVKFVVEKASDLAKADAYAAITGLVEKIADLKLKNMVWEILMGICEHLGLHFVFTLIHSLAKKHKNPKVLSESLNWMKAACEEFGLGPWVDVRTMIDWVVAELNNTIPAVKTAAINFIGSLHRFLGPPLADMIRANVKPTLMTNIEEEFGKNPQDSTFSAKRKIRGLKSKAPMDSQGGGGMMDIGEESVQDSTPVFNPDDVLPRMDISEAINTKIAAQLNDGNWKVRKEGLEGIEQLLEESGNRIQPNVGDLFVALRGRMADANKNLIAYAIKVFSKLTKAMGKPIEKQGKIALEPALLSLSDAKPVVRGAVIELMEAWCSVASVNSLLPDFITAVSSSKSHVDGKKDAFTWLNKLAVDGKIKDENLEPCLKACAVGIADKSSQVREATNALLQTLITQSKDQVVSIGGSMADRDARQVVMEAIGKLTGNSSGVTTTSEKPSTTKSHGKSASNNEESVKGKKGSASKRSSTPQTRKGSLTPTPKKTSVAQQAPALFLINDQKAHRSHKHRGKRAKFDGNIPAEEESSLKVELEPFVAPHLHSLLFSADFKKHCSAAEIIRDAVHEYYDEILELLDYLFRWCVLRIHQGKVQCLTLTLEMLKSMFEKLASENYKLTEYEAVILLPCIVEKSGHNQDRIKKYHREILCLATTVYPSSKVFSFVSQGLVSKNTRTKVECAEEIGSMIDRDGMKIASGNKQSKVFEEIALAVSDRDKALRAACLSTLTIVYDFEGQYIWKLLGKISSQQKSILEERFKAHHKVLQEKGLMIGHRGSRPSTPVIQQRMPTPEIQRSRHRNRDSQSMDTDSYDGETYSKRSPSQMSMRSLQSPMPLPDPPEIATQESRDNIIVERRTTPIPDAASPLVQNYPRPVRTKVEAIETSQSPIPTPPSDIQEAERRSDQEIEEIWSRAMITIQSEDPEEAIESLKVLCYELIQAKNGSPGTLQLLTDSANELVKELNSRLLSFVWNIVEEEDGGRSDAHVSERVCKYTLNTFLQTFNTPCMAPAVERQVLLELISSLLQLLLDDRLTPAPEGPTIMKGMNALMLKILEMSQINAVIGVLIFLLRIPPPFIKTSGKELQDRFENLVVKCLIKTTKRMVSLLETRVQDDALGFDISEVIVEIHDFFSKLHPDELRRRGEEDDKPLRMIKTILYELCKYKGVEIENYLNCLPLDGDRPPIILGYINVNLKSLHAANQIAGPIPEKVGRRLLVVQDYFRSMERVDRPPHEVLNPPRSPEGLSRPGSANIELKTELSVIFKKIGDKRTTQEGMECLYRFQKQHPEVDIKPLLVNTSEAFKSYIEKGLKLIKEKEERSSEAVDPMEIDEGDTQPIEDMPVTWTEMPPNESANTNATAATAPFRNQPVS